jgi:hypothetical protein
MACACLPGREVTHTVPTAGLRTSCMSETLFFNRDLRKTSRRNLELYHVCSRSLAVSATFRPHSKRRFVALQTTAKLLAASRPNLNHLKLEKRACKTSKQRRLPFRSLIKALLSGPKRLFSRSMQPQAIAVHWHEPSRCILYRPQRSFHISGYYSAFPFQRTSLGTLSLTEQIEAFERDASRRLHRNSTITIAQTANPMQVSPLEL